MGGREIQIWKILVGGEVKKASEKLEAAYAY